MRTNEFGQTEVDTRTDSPVSIGADMWAGSGDMSVAEAVAAYGSVVFAAYAIRDLFAESGATWVDYDGHELSVYSYVKSYLEQAAQSQADNQSAVATGATKEIVTQPGDWRDWSPEGKWNS